MFAGYDVCPFEAEDANYGGDEQVAWVCPQYSRGEVDRAGEILVKPIVDALEYERALSIMNNWRSSHSYPLQALKMALRNRAEKIAPSVLVAQRLKRLSSVTTKLQRNPQMKLSQMQDLGGCRAIMSSMKEVDGLIEMYYISHAKNPTSRSEFVKKFDYISEPKNDGYRGVHLVYKYRSRSEHYKQFNGLRIEIQIRTKLQHAWATAVETVSTFTGQSLKANVGTEQWKRFFALMGSAIAVRERRPTVPGTPTMKNESLEELRQLSECLNVNTVLRGWNTAMRMADTEDYANSHLFLLILDTKQMMISVQGFQKNELPVASERYLIAEKENQLSTERQTVLVSVDSIDALRAAYPNYYVDTADFLAALKMATAKPKS